MTEVEKPRPGPVILIGGAEDKLDDRVILSRFVSLAGGPDAHIVVITTASSLGDAANELYRQVFVRLGVSNVVGLRPLTRRDANSAKASGAIRQATGVFLTGGNQLRLASAVSGTRIAKAILAAHRRGAVVAGTSAGASAMAEHMMAFGASGATPKHRMAQLAEGLGLLKDLVVDQHFEQRTRLGRLLAVVAQSPSLIGMGLDEDTAAIVFADHTLEVIGRGAVTLIDGTNVVTDAYRASGHRPMMVSGAIIHSVPPGYRFDLRRRRIVPEVVSSPRRRTAEARARGKVVRMTSRLNEEQPGPPATRAPTPDREASE
jgi:cyanophycinase